VRVERRPLARRGDGHEGRQAPGRLFGAEREGDLSSHGVRERFAVVRAVDQRLWHRPSSLVCAGS